MELAHKRVYGPGMNEGITKMITACDSCQTFLPEQMNPTML